MIIVSGPIWVEPAIRDAYIEDCQQVVAAARAAEGCLDFYLAADPLEEDRINVYEEWVSPEAATAFRASGPSPSQQAAIRDARVLQHTVASSDRL